MKLPPGSSGLPLIGETLAFLGNGFEFMETRVARHGRVFRTKILGRDAAVICGPEASSVWIDPERIRRAGSMPPHVERLFGGRSLPLLDGVDHHQRRVQVEAGLDASALEAMAAALDSAVAAAIERWRQSGEIELVAESKRLAIEGICAAFLPPGDDRALAELRAAYGELLPGFTALPIDLPGTAFHRAVAARDRIFAIFDRAIARARAGEGGIGLTRMLAASADGAKISDADARLELHHVVVAGFIVYAELVAAVRELAPRPQLVAELVAEIRASVPTGGPNFRALAALPRLAQVIMEIKRLCPILASVFGKAKIDFELGGYTIPAGWMVMWGWRPSLVDPDVFTDPMTFDPDRFAPPRAEHRRHPQAFVPHGPVGKGSHNCPGTDLATLFMATFLIRLLRDRTWEVVGPIPAYDFKKAPPEPVGGLRLRIR